MQQQAPCLRESRYSKLLNFNTKQIEIVKTQGLTSTPYLEQCAVAVNDALKLFVCLPCKTAYTSENLGEHLRTTHGISKSEESEAQFANIAKQLSIAAKYPAVEASMEGVQPFAGLAITDCWGCSLCPVAGSHAYILKRHIPANHQGKQGEPVPNIQTQVLNRAITKTNFRIKASPPTTASNIRKSPEEALMSMFSEYHAITASAARTAPNARLISPWLNRTRFHILVEGYNTEELRHLVSLPKKGTDLAWVHSLVLSYMEDSSALVEFTQLQSLQRINSYDPEHE